MNPTRKSQLRAALAPRPQTPRATVRFVTPQPQGRALVAAYKATAAAARYHAELATDPSVRAGFIKIAERREARLAALEAELRGRQQPGELFLTHS